MTIYVERQISGSADLGAAGSTLLAGRTVALAKFGPVSLVKADTRVETMLDNSDNPAGSNKYFALLRRTCRFECHRADPYRVPS